MDPDWLPFPNINFFKRNLIYPFYSGKRKWESRTVKNFFLEIHVLNGGRNGEESKLFLETIKPNCPTPSHYHIRRCRPESGFFGPGQLRIQAFTHSLLLFQSSEPHSLLPPPKVEYQVYKHGVVGVYIYMYACIYRHTHNEER